MSDADQFNPPFISMVVLVLMICLWTLESTSVVAFVSCYNQINKLSSNIPAVLDMRTHANTHTALSWHSGGREKASEHLAASSF